jgi:hypothetical protein
MSRKWIQAFIALATIVSPAPGQSGQSHYNPVYARQEQGAGWAVVGPSVESGLTSSETAAPSYYWFRAEYLGWWLTGSELPPLITASPAGTPRAQAGVLGAPGTRVLFGDESVNDNFRSGVRITFGGWLDECRSTGFEVRLLTLDRQTDGFAAGSPDGSLIVSRPFLDASTGRQNAELVSFPGVLAGAVVADADSGKFCLLDALCRQSWCRDCSSYLDFLAGYRYLRFEDRVRVVERLTPLAAAGSQINLVDEFNASNRFHGGVFGLAAGYTDGAMTIELRAHIAVGETSRTVAINGATQIITPAGTTLATGGLLAQSTNIGTHRSSDWTVVPDVELTVGWWLTNYCRVLVGYSCLYWPGVARAGEQIDFSVNPTQLPPAGTLVGPARPAFALHSSDLWAHGFSIGIELRF